MYKNISWQQKTTIDKFICTFQLCDNFCLPGNTESIHSYSHIFKIKLRFPFFYFQGVRAGNACLLENQVPALVCLFSDHRHTRTYVITPGCICLCSFIQISFFIPPIFWFNFSCYAGSIKMVPICEIGAIFMGHGGIQQVSAKRTSCGLTPAYFTIVQ